MGIVNSFCVLFPMSIPRNVSALRYFSLTGVLYSMYLSLAVAGVFLKNKELVPSVKDNFHEMEAFKLSFSGLISSFPFIIFGYMYFYLYVLMFLIKTWCAMILRFLSV